MPAVAGKATSAAVAARRARGWPVARVPMARRSPIPRPIRVSPGTRSPNFQQKLLTVPTSAVRGKGAAHQRHDRRAGAKGRRLTRWGIGVLG